MTYKPTLKEAILIQKIGAGDFEAIDELWTSLFGVPVDPTRKAEDICQDIVDYITPPEPKAPKEEVPPTPEAMIAASFVAAQELVDRLLGPQRRVK